jgi:hypothetical protein
MKYYRIDMWQAGRKVMLADILKRLSTPSSIEWSLLEFHGTGTAPDGKGMVEFENEVRRCSDGYRFDGEAMEKFASELTDIDDLDLVGMDTGRKSVEIGAFDSGHWEVVVDETRSSFVSSDAWPIASEWDGSH